MSSIVYSQNLPHSSPPVQFIVIPSGYLVLQTLESPILQFSACRMVAQQNGNTLPDPTDADTQVKALNQIQFIPLIKEAGEVFTD